jgi:hypothetical protein
MSTPWSGPAILLVLGVAAVACGDGTAPEETSVTVQFNDLTSLDAASEGTYEGWVIDSDGMPHSTGKFTLNANGGHTFESPIASPVTFVLTVEPPGDADEIPSDQKLLGGSVSGGTLSALGFVTASATASFSSSPGMHVLLTPTDGPDTNEDAGIWLLDPSGMAPVAGVTNLPELASGWVYEGWVVHMPGTAQQVAISYGKYAPQSGGELSGRDSDAGGPFSGAPGDLMAGPPFPGGDFVAANGNAVPGGLTLPVDFNGEDAVNGDSEWMHVISIEPTFDQGESTLDAVPFQLKPFGNPFGDGGPTDLRTIEPLSALPSGTVSVTTETT